MVCQCLLAPSDDLYCDDSEECNGDPHIDNFDEKMKRREDYLKSMFMCATPEALAPLAAKMYQKFVELCPGYMHEAKSFEDEKRVLFSLHACTFIIINFLFGMQVLRKYYEPITVRKC